MDVLDAAVDGVVAGGSSEEMQQVGPYVTLAARARPPAVFPEQAFVGAAFDAESVKGEEPASAGSV